MKRRGYRFTSAAPGFGLAREEEKINLFIAIEQRRLPFAKTIHIVNETNPCR